MFQLRGRLLFDKLHGGSNRFNPLNSSRVVGEKKPVSHPGNFQAFNVLPDRKHKGFISPDGKITGFLRGGGNSPNLP